MGFMSMAGSLAKTGASVAGTVLSLGKNALSLGKSVCGSTIGKLGLGAGVVAILNRNNPEMANATKSVFGGIKDFFKPMLDKIKDVGRNIAGKIAGKALDTGNTLSESIAVMKNVESEQTETTVSKITEPVIENTADVEATGPEMC